MYVDSKHITLGQYLHQWLESYAKVNVTYTTYASYRSNLLLHLGEILENKLEDFNPFIIQKKYSDMLKQGYSPTTVNHTHRILNHALKQVIQWRLLVVNPCDTVPPPKKAYIEKEPLTIEEISLIKNHLVENNKSYYIVFMIAITTGMRRSEIAALEWNDTNFENKRIYVSKAMKLNGRKVVIDGIKNKSSIRSIDITNSLYETLKSWYKEQKVNKLKYGKYYAGNNLSNKSRDFIYTYGNGNFIRLDYYGRKLHEVLKTFEIDKHIRFHDLRHTHATLLLKQNIEAKVIQERLGHSNISTTTDLYSHITRNVQKEAINKLNKIL